MMGRWSTWSPAWLSYSFMGPWGAVLPEQWPTPSSRWCEPDFRRRIDLPMDRSRLTYQLALPFSVMAVCTS